MKDGYGKKVWVNGSSYEGLWRLDLKHGMGTDKIEQGEVFTGMFRNDLRHGSGILTWPQFGFAPPISYSQL